MTPGLLFLVMSEVSSSSTSSSSCESGVDTIEVPAPPHLLKQQQAQMQLLPSAVAGSMEKMKLDQSSGNKSQQHPISGAGGGGGGGSVSSSSSASDVESNSALQPLPPVLPTASIRNTFGPPPPPRASPASSLHP